MNFFLESNLVDLLRHRLSALSPVCTSQNLASPIIPGCPRRSRPGQTEESRSQVQLTPCKVCTSPQRPLGGSAAPIPSQKEAVPSGPLQSQHSWKGCRLLPAALACLPLEQANCRDSWGSPRWNSLSGGSARNLHHKGQRGQPSCALLEVVWQTIPSMGSVLTLSFLSVFVHHCSNGNEEGSDGQLRKRLSSSGQKNAIPWAGVRDFWPLWNFFFQKHFSPRYILLKTGMCLKG